jgi:hypothetical protein
MKPTFDEQLIAAVRLAGPDALPSAVFIEMGDDRAGILGLSLAKVISRLERLSDEGVLIRGIIVDEKGRDRRGYSMGTGRLRENEARTDVDGWTGSPSPA